MPGSTLVRRCSTRGVAPAYIAAATDTIRLGTHVYVLPLRQEYDAVGVPFEKRGSRMEEFVPLPRRLWTRSSVEPSGARAHCRSALDFRAGGFTGVAKKRAATKPAANDGETSKSSARGTGPRATRNSGSPVPARRKATASSTDGKPSTPRRAPRSTTSRGESVQNGPKASGRAATKTRRTAGGGSTRDRQLSEHSIVDAALVLIARHGAHALSMRMLADELAVSPMAAYYHVGGKDNLLRLVGNSVLAEVVVPAQTEPWQARLRALMVGQREALRQYPGLREALRGVDLEERRRLEDAEFDVLVEAGFPPAQAVQAFRAILDWSLGNSFVESSLRDPDQRRARTDWTKALRVAFDRKVMPPMTSDTYFEFGLDVVMIGLQAQLATVKAAPRRRRSS